MTTKQQEKLDELSEFLQHYLSEDDFKKAMIIVNDMLGYLKKEVMDYIKGMLFKDLESLDEKGKKMFLELLED